MKTVTIHGGTKEEIYTELAPQIASLVEGEPDLVANLANVTAALKSALEAASWVGFYLAHGEELVLGPFQGKVACVRIKTGTGVCGIAASRHETIVVDDVEKFPGHIYCDPDSRSEIVVPIVSTGRVVGVLDLDSRRTSGFDSTDKLHLEKLVTTLIAPLFSGRNLSNNGVP